MNWGIKIIIGMAIAMAAVVATGVYMVSQDSDTLEEADYYEKGLSYDLAYNKKQNVVLNNAPIIVSVEQDSLSIAFADKINTGIIYFKRPSDSDLDKAVHFATAKSFYKISLKDFKKGLWHVAVDWKNKDTPYLQERSIYIN